MYKRQIYSLVKSARGLTHMLESGSLQRYIALLLLSALALLVVALSELKKLNGGIPLSPVDGITALGMLILCLMAVLTVVFHRNRLKALMTLSCAGLMVALAFARYSAPDLALTQLSVEVVTIILLVLALFFMPDRTPQESSSLRGLRDAALAGGAGIAIALLTYAVMTLSLIHI